MTRRLGFGGLLACIFLALFGLSLGVRAQTISWANWVAPANFPNHYPGPPTAFDYTNGVTGSLTLPDTTVVSLSLVGEVNGTDSCFSSSLAGCPTGAGYWKDGVKGWQEGGSAVFPAGTFTSANVPSLPPQASFISQTGYVDQNHTLTFSKPVSNIVMNVVSLGGGRVSAYQFTQDFVILSQDPRCTTPGSLGFYCLVKTGNTLSGWEGSGTIQFKGTFSSISWSVTQPEYYSGFTIGVTSKAVSPGITKTFSPTTVNAGDTSTLTIQISNPTGAAVPGANVTDALPSPLQIAAAGGSTTCTLNSPADLNAAAGATIVSLANATIPIGGCSITVPVQWPNANASMCTGAPVTNTITPGTGFTTSQGQVNTPATATLACLAAPNLTITKSDASPSLVVGQNATYTLTVTNAGGAAAASATVLESLPPNLTLVSASGTGWACNTGVSPIRCTYSTNIAPSAAASPLNVVVQPTAAAAGSVLVNYASVDTAAGAAPPAPGASCAPASACAQSSGQLVANPSAVPSLTELALLAMSLLVGWLGFAHLHEVRRQATGAR